MIDATTIVSALRAAYPGASADELCNIAQTTVVEYGGGDALYDEVCTAIEAGP